MGTAAIGTFHERRGDQSLLDNHDADGNAWARALGNKHDQRWNSKVEGIGYQLAPEIESRMWGIQAGSDLLVRNDAEREDRAGVFYAHTETRGTVFGNTLAVDGNLSGELTLKGDSIGLYWTRMNPGRWYLDAVTMYTRLDGEAWSNLGTGAKTRGNAVAASLEGGMLFPIKGNWTLEPQGQLIWQHIGFDDASDAYSSIHYQDFNAFTGRMGLRLENNATVRGYPLQSFLSVDVWHNFSKSSNVTFRDTNVATRLDSTALDLRAGMAMKWRENLDTYVSLGYTTNLEGQMQHGINGIVGLRLLW